MNISSRSCFPHKRGWRQWRGTGSDASEMPIFPKWPTTTFGISSFHCTFKEPDRSQQLLHLLYLDFENKGLLPPVVTPEYMLTVFHRSVKVSGHSPVPPRNLLARHINNHEFNIAHVSSLMVLATSHSCFSRFVTNHTAKSSSVQGTRNLRLGTQSLQNLRG